MADEIAIKVEGVNKTFKLPHEKQNSIKSLFVNVFSGKRSFEKQHVLKDISFEIKKGEFFGIVGRNGSGKSTLLKLIAGIYSPDTGAIQVNGKLTPFIELGVGFNPELTGRENVFLNGALLGFNRKEMNAMYQEIVDFAEIEKFMDQKLKNYSSGMQVRLAFSIAIQAKSEILVLDEVLAVGDLDFQRKCYTYFNDLKQNNKTVVLVTHDMSAVRRFCMRAALIQNGKVTFIGSPDKAAEKYEKLNLRAAEKRLETTNEEMTSEEKIVQYKNREGSREVEIVKTETYNVQTGKAQNTFDAREKIGMRVTYKVHKLVVEPSLSFIFQDQQRVTVFATNNWLGKVETRVVKPGEIVVFEVEVDNVFTDGEYTTTTAAESKDFSDIYDRIERNHRFLIGGHKLNHATTHPPHSMKVLYEKKEKGA